MMEDSSAFDEMFQFIRQAKPSVFQEFALKFKTLGALGERVSHDLVEKIKNPKSSYLVMGVLKPRKSAQIKKKIEDKM